MEGSLRGAPRQGATTSLFIGYKDAELVFCDQILELFYYLTGALNVAGASIQTVILSRIHYLYLFFQDFAELP